MEVLSPNLLARVSGFPWQGGLAEAMSRAITMRVPRMLHFGAGTIGRVGDVVATLGATRCLIVGGGRSLDVFREHAANVLAETGIESVYAAPVPREPTVASATQVLIDAESCAIDLVIGIGGGSALDVAKVVASLLRTGLGFDAIVGADKVPPRRVGLVCIPTTSGSGSEVSPNAILLDHAACMKRASVSPHLVPDATIVDPVLACGVPADVTGPSGIDALCHCIEAVVNKLAHPLLDSIALQGVGLIASNLERAVESGSQLGPRSAMALGSLFGGLCLGPVNTTAVHALSYPLQGIFGVPHGVANAVMLEHVLAFNASHAVERCAAVARAMGASPDPNLHNLASCAAPLVAHLMESCGVPRRLRDLGVPPDRLDELCDSAMTVTRLLDRNPRPVTRADAMELYRRAY